MAGEIESPLAGVAYTPDMQPALTEEDFYTLLNFALRTALVVIRGADEAWLEEARAAIAAVDEDRVDWRDVSVASALVEDPDSSGYVPIETPDGPALVLSPGTSVWAQLGPATDEEAESQQFTIFLAETAREAGRICAVTVARSWVKEVAAFEQPGSLERFREPFTAALRAPSGG